MFRRLLIGPTSSGDVAATSRTLKGSWSASMFSKKAIVVRLRSTSQLGEEGVMSSIGGGREMGEGSAGSTSRTRKGSWPASMFSERAIVVRPCN